MEGITGCMYRRLHAEIFGGADRYFAPFIYASCGGVIGSGNLAELAPENQGSVKLIPQLLTNRAQDFLDTAKTLHGMGYEEVNLNLGCPSKTVVSKGRGAGFLKDPDGLEAFLDRVFSKVDMKVSLKTRIGFERPEEFDRLLKIYGRFPISELIIHPRTGRDMYKGRPDMAAFQKAVDQLAIPICYNGDVMTAADGQNFNMHYPQITRLMAGRGLLANPALARELHGGPPLQASELTLFHDRLLAGYDERMAGSKKVLSLMKEQWQYWRLGFAGETRALTDRLLRVTDRDLYLKLVNEIFASFAEDRKGV